MKALIEKHGGQASFSRKTGIPLRTVENWKYGKATPPCWLYEKLEFWLTYANKAGRKNDGER